MAGGAVVTEKKTNKELVLAGLSEGRRSPADLVEKTGVPAASLRKVLSELSRAGKISKCEDGRWMRGEPPKPKPEEDPNIDRVLRMLEAGPLDSASVARALSLDAKSVTSLRKKMQRTGDVTVTGRTNGARWHLPGAVVKPSPVTLETPMKKVRFDKLDMEDPVVAALVEQRAAADDRHTRELARIDRMLAIAGEK